METLFSINTASFPEDSAEKGDEESAKTDSQSVYRDNGKRLSIQSSRVMFNYFLNFSREDSLA